MVSGRLYPALGFMQAATVKTNFGWDYKTNPFKWTPANNKDWHVTTIAK
jgi:hypothetical protein